MTFLKLGNQITKTKCRQKNSIKERRFKSHFGITPNICEIVWTQIIGRAPVGFKPNHLLWGLNFLKQYTVEHNRHSLLKADEKTIREWSWTTVRLLSELDVVSDIPSTLFGYDVNELNIDFCFKFLSRLFGKIEK